MRKRIFIIAGILLLVVGIFVITSAVQKSRAKHALTAYIAKLKAQGEPMTWGDLGYPPPAETDNFFDMFLAAASELGQPQFTLTSMHFVAPGRAEAGRAVAQPLVSAFGTGRSNAPSWDEFNASMLAGSNALVRIRFSLQNPPRYSQINLTNPATSNLVPSFLRIRKAAQWLAADSLAAMHEEDLGRAKADLHGLTQLAQLHRDDAILVSAMIRVAITGLGLSSTWDAVQAEGWDEVELKDMQHDWEGIDLVGSMERAIEGERVYVIPLFHQAANPAVPKASRSIGLGSVRDIFADAYWRSHQEEDQLLYLQTIQQQLTILRQLKTNAPGVSVLKELRDQQDEFDNAMQDPFTSYRYAVSSVAMPNVSKAVAVVVKRETQRRMTITAIALKRYHVQNAEYPATLKTLVPDFLSQVPIDPMSGQAFHYRTNAYGGFTLYSVGDDGRDDGGDPSCTNAVKSFDLWTGRDAVWPKTK